MVEISIILPAFNEGFKIERSLRVLETKLNSTKLDYEIIVVDDGSRDDTLLKVQRCKGPFVQIFHYDKNRGKGFAVRHGMSHAKGRYKLFMDVDLSTCLEAMDVFLDHMRTGNYDMIIGVRQQVVKQPWPRRFLGRGFIALSQWCVNTDIKDFTCGFKMFNEKGVEVVFSRQHIFRWAFDTELLHIATAHGLRILQLPVIWRHHPDSHVNLARDLPRALIDLLRIKCNAVCSRYC